MVASNITATSSREMLAALVAGERDAAVMADLAHSRCGARSRSDRCVDRALRRSPRGDRRAAATKLEQTETGLRGIDAELEIRMVPSARQLELLGTIPGVGLVTAQGFIAETGGDMSKFGSPERLAAWVGLAPAIHESAGKRTPAGSRRGSKFLTSMLVEASNSASRTKNTYLASQFKRIASRRGHGRAAVAVAHSRLVSAYWMLVRDEPYQDLGPDWLTKRNDEAHARRLVAQLERLGHTVVLDPVA
ncbi:transposase [Longivirga aurantiaca]|uniref:Transposase n=1 Tax=Longivirga aurantiaca TaxID=1837743 RepID=A0ABW1SY41_9ACTN